MNEKTLRIPKIQTPAHLIDTVYQLIDKTDH